MEAGACGQANAMITAMSLTMLCAKLPELRDALRNDPRRVQLEQAVADALRGESVTASLRGLGIEVDNGGDRGTNPGMSWWPKHPVTGVYLCPEGQCERLETIGPRDRPPECHLRGRILRFIPDSQK
jgi:hypothetical protein